MIEIISTTNVLQGYTIKKYLGVAKGIVVRTPTIKEGITSTFKALIGGKMGALTEMCEKARTQAFEEMLKEAEEAGANAIIGLRYDSSDISFADNSAGATEIICYGTAVVIEENP